MRRWSPLPECALRFLWLGAIVLTQVGFHSGPEAVARGLAGGGAQAGAAADTIPSIEELARWMGPDGEPERGREGIRRRAARGAVDEENRWLQLLAALERIAPAAAPSAIFAVALAEEGEGARATDLILEALPEASAADEAPLLALAALLAQEDDPLRAAEIRNRLLEGHPTAPEAPEAGLRQAKWLLSIDHRRGEGLALLEALIVSAPDHPITPEARRIFLRERGSGGGAPPPEGS